jgi:hypothetical protein
MKSGEIFGVAIGHVLGAGNNLLRRCRRRLRGVAERGVIGGRFAELLSEGVLALCMGEEVVREGKERRVRERDERMGVLGAGRRGMKRFGLWGDVVGEKLAKGRGWVVKSTPESTGEMISEGLIARRIIC